MNSATRVIIEENTKEWICFIIANDNSCVGRISMYKDAEGFYYGLNYHTDTKYHWHLYEMSKVAKRIFNKHRFNRATPEQILKTLNAKIISE